MEISIEDDMLPFLVFFRNTFVVHTGAFHSYIGQCYCITSFSLFVKIYIRVFQEIKVEREGE
jgi:hypothetical protein